MHLRRHPSGRTLLSVVVLLSFLAVLVVTPVASTPPPRPLCEPCGSGFADDTHWYGVVHGMENETPQISVEHSTATIHVRENGTATWTIRNQLANKETARYFRKNRTMLDTIAENPGFGTLLDARVVGTKTVVFRYRTTTAAATPGDVVRFDGFRDVRGGGTSGLGADRLTVVGPPGTVVTRMPGGAQIDGNSFILTSYHDNGDGSFVTFAQSGGVVGEAWSFVAVAQALVGTVIQNLFVVVLLPTLLLLGLLVAFVRTGSKIVERTERTFDKMTKIVGAFGFLGLVVGMTLATQGGARLAFVFLIIGGAYLSLALVLHSDVRLTLSRVSATVYGAWLVGFVLAGVITAVADPYVFARLLKSNYYVMHDVLFATFVSLLLLSLVVVGYVATNERYRRVATALPSAILGVTLLASSSLTEVQSLTGIFIFVVLGVILLILFILVGFPAFLLGRTVPKAEGD